MTRGAYGTHRAMRLIEYMELREQLESIKLNYKHK